MSDTESDYEIQFNIRATQNPENHSLNTDPAQESSIDLQNETEISKDQNSIVGLTFEGGASPRPLNESQEGQTQCLSVSSDTAHINHQVQSDCARAQPSQRRSRFSPSPRRQLSEPDQRPDIGVPDRSNCATDRQIDIPGRYYRSPAVDNPDQHGHYHHISADKPDHRSETPDRYVNKTGGRSRAPYRRDVHATGHCFDTSDRFDSSPKGRFFAGNRFVHIQDKYYKSPCRHARNPQRRHDGLDCRSRYRSRRCRSVVRQRSYSPQRRYRRSNIQAPMPASGRGDINQSNRIARQNARVRPDCLDQDSLSVQRPARETYDCCDTVPENEQPRPRIGYQGDPVYSHACYQAAPRIRPEPYTGCEDWEEYQSHFEDCAELSGWDSRSKVLFLAASLRGQARTYYMSLDTCEKRSYSSLVYRMSQRFGSSRHAIKWLNQLELRQRNPGESITALGDDLRQLAKKAYRSLDTDAQETLALNQLYKLIPVEMKCRCIDHDCQSVQQAVEVIERYEAILGEATQERKKGNVRNIEQSQQPQNPDPNISSILKKCLWHSS